MEQIIDDRVHLPSLPDVIYDRLRREIATGEITPGPLRLRPLAERFGTSQIPVREALRRLESDGLVSFLSNRAIVVNAVSRDELDEIFGIRKELEAFALRVAARRIADDQELLGRLEELMDTMDAQEADAGAWRTTNEEFHDVLYGAAQLPRLHGLIRNLWVSVEPYLRMYVTAAPSLRGAQEQHREMVRRISTGDVAGAEELLREHLDATRLVVLDLMAD